MTVAPGSGAPRAGRSTITRALGAIARLEARLKASEDARTEPIAIIGMACRFPGGVETPEAYWTLLTNGVDAVTEVPRDRWDLAKYYDPDPDASGKMYARHGGFLDRVSEFDGWFFRISPREAQSLDPQQRLLLEVAWEALEDAGVAADRLAGSPTGVFVGLTTNDYAQLLMRDGEGRNLDAFFFTGNPGNAAAGRLAYAFGFQGPAIALDTACSSSLVSVHQACISLRAGDCRTALAGGVNLVLAPENTIAVCRTRALSPDGRCKTFDESANGFVRSEGCGLVVLKRLSDAVADGDPIRAVIRGSAVNQDGASSGFTVPNGPAQQAVIRQALGTIAPGNIDYLEAHGTGTALGDPIEVGAAAAVLGQDRDPGRPLYIGSVKTNIGHAEAAAGIAALIKTVLAIEHGEIPPHLHCQHPNPLIAWDTLPVRIPHTRTPWPNRPDGPDGPGPRLAGVSAFGASGTNAHVVVEAAPPVGPAKKPEGRTPHLLVLSAKRRDALRALVTRYREYLATAESVDVGDLCFSAATGRAHHQHRVALVTDSTQSAESQLDTILADWRPEVGATDAQDRPRAARVAFLFTGQGSQYSGMGRTLYDTQPIFRRAIDQCAAIAASRMDAPLLDLLFNGDERLNATQYTQPALFALEYALAQMLAGFGVTPSVVMGHGVGEFAAACVAGVLSVDDALMLVMERGRPTLDAFETTARAATYSAPATTWISSVTGGQISAAPDAAYWRRQCREAVRFAEGIDAVAAAGCDVLVEIGPQPTLIRLAAQCRPEAGLLGLAPLSPGKDDWHGVLTTLAALYARGATLDFGALDAPSTRTRIRLPHYPFQRTAHWISRKDDPMPDSTPQTPTNEQPPARREAVLAVLRTYIAGLLQAPESEINIHLPFLEMGADSLVMVDAIGLVEKEFGLKLAIRRFFEDLSTIDALAGYIDAALPAETAPTAVAAAAPMTQPSVPAATAPSIPMSVMPGAIAATADSTSIERVMIEQTRFVAQFMAQQTELMRLALGSPSGPPVTPPAPTVSAATRTAVSSTPVTADVHLGAPAPPPMPWGNPAEIRARGLTETQHQHLEALIERYTARTKRSKERTQQSRAVLADSRATVGFRLSTKEMLYPIWGARSEGSRTWDIDNNEYIDYTMGFGVHLFGHKPDFIQHALREELEAAVELGARSHLVGEVAALFTELTGLDRVAFCNSGTEGVMAAVRLARAATGRDKIAIFTNAYHGHADTTLARAQRQNGELGTVPMAPGVPGAIASDIIVLEYGTDEALDILRKRGHELAAVMVEPVQSRHLKLQPRAFLHELRSLTTDIGAALIFDEMITGFRTAPGGAQEYFGVKADLATYGKIVGGGMPIGLVAGSSAFMDGVDGGAWQYGDGSFPAADRTAFGGTFCQHPLSMAAARATLRQIKAQGPALQQQLNGRTDRLVHTLNDYFASEEVPIEATNFSSLFRFEFSSNLDLLFYHMLEKGIYIWEWRSCFLSTAHSDADITRFVDVVKESVEDLRRGGFTPRPTPPSGTPPSTSSGAGSSTPVGTVPSGPAATGPAALTSAPLSEAQRQLWMLLEIEDTSSLAYNVSTTMELEGDLDRDRLRAALQHVVDRHSALRTTIAPDGTHQLVHPTLDVQVALTDLSSQTILDQGRDQVTALETWRTTVSREPIDLVRGPVFKPRLACLAPNRHVLMLTAHHILADGMTMGVVMDELAASYNALSTNAALPDAAPMQFTEYLTRCAEARDSPAMQAHKAFWLEQFADTVPQLDLPLDRPRPSVKTYAGGRVSRQVDSDTLQALRRVSREHGCTLNMTLLTAFALLLHRYCRQDDIVVGTSVSGRPFPGSLNMAGYCTHLVPVRSRLEDNPSFSTMLRGMKGRLLDVFDHQDLPFAELLHTLPLPRSSGAFPLISAVFNLEPVSALPQLHGLSTRLLPQAVSFTPFDLFVNVIDAGNTLLVDADFNADLFAASTIERMMEGFDALMRAITAAPATAVRALPLMTDEERDRILVEWNDTARTLPDTCVHTYFEQWCEEQPTATAWQMDDHEVSYAELNARANQLAWWLRANGVGPDVLVAVCCERSLEMMVAIVGILKAGGAYVPIDPEYPEERVSFMVKDAGASVVLTVARWQALVSSDTDGEAAGHTVFCLDTDWHLLESYPTRNPHTMVGAAHLAYMIYTSGSTGRPKGALNTHRGIANRLLWMQDAFGLTPHDRVLQKTPFSFDVSVWELIWPLLTGARVVMATPGGHRDPGYLVDLIERAGISTIHFVPSMLNVFLEALDETGRDRCRTLRRVICSGEALSPELVRRYGVALTAPLHNLYGPTEAAVDVTAWACDPAQVGSTIPIGRPIANTQIYILDECRQPVPVGVAGELYIGGVGVGRGYLNRPDLTQERFVPDPFRDTGTGHLYRTGDLARFREDGAVEYLGRLDDQVKVRGFRIELGEITSRALEHAGVGDAVTVADPLPTGDARLLVYVVAAGQPDGLEASLRAHLARALPVYMVPSAIVILDALPLLPNGKVDRRQLPRPSVTTTHVAPEPGVESAIAAIWEDVLRQAPIGALDDFFALGGNSLSAGQVVSRIGRQLQVRIGIKDIFVHPTVRALAAGVAPSPGPDLPPLVAAEPQAHYPLSHAQRRFWIQDRLAGADQANCHPVSFLIEGALNRGALRQAFQALVQRHEILRTIFVEVDGDARQMILPADAAGFEMVETTLVDSSNVDAAIRLTEQQQASIRMDLTTGPLFRVHVVEVGPQQHYCVCSLHHMITDGWSVGVLLDDLTRFYDRAVAGTDSVLAPLALQYRDFAAWEQQFLGSEASGPMRAHWKTTLDGVPPLVLPSDLPPTPSPYVRASRRVTIGSQLAHDLEALSRRQGGTLFMAMLSCLKVLLYRHTAQPDICIGTPASLRFHADLEPQIGPYLNILALRDRVAGEDTLTTVLQRVRTTTLDAFTHLLFPFDQVVNDLRLKRVPGRNPLFDVGFTLQNQHQVQTRRNSDHLHVREIPGRDNVFDDPEAATDLWFIADPREDDLSLEVVYNGARFSADRIDRLSGDFLAILSAFVADPDTRVKAVPLTTITTVPAGRPVTIDLGL